MTITHRRRLSRLTDLPACLLELAALERDAAAALLALERRGEPEWATLIETLRLDQALARTDIDRAVAACGRSPKRDLRTLYSVDELASEPTPVALARVTIARLEAYDDVVEGLNLPPDALREQLQGARAAAEHQVLQLEHRIGASPGT
ncbi:MAG: hypothetical protein AAGA56_02170 [Myxococcota bacterium]